MILTEEEYMTKWCPMSRCLVTTDDGIAGVNREKGGTPKLGAKCIGSDCGMWNWHSVSNSTGYCGLKNLNIPS